MTERAHPDHPGFQNRWGISLRWGFMPWLTQNRNPYRAAFFWRYSWANQYCADKNVLDIPCGMGWGTSLLKSARAVTGVDISSEAITEARDRYANSRINFELGDMTVLAFPDDIFDVVCCLEGIEHISKLAGELFIKESWRVIQPGGLLLLSSPYCPHKTHSGNVFHVYEYGPEEIRELINKKYIIEDMIIKNVDSMTVLYFCCRKQIE